MSHPTYMCWPCMHVYEFLCNHSNLVQLTQQGMEKLNDRTIDYARSTNHDHRSLEALQQLIEKRIELNIWKITTFKEKHNQFIALSATTLDIIDYRVKGTLHSLVKIEIPVKNLLLRTTLCTCINSLCCTIVRTCCTLNFCLYSLSLTLPLSPSPFFSSLSPFLPFFFTTKSTLCQ